VTFVLLALGFLSCMLLFDDTSFNRSKSHKGGFKLT